MSKKKKKIIYPEFKSDATLIDTHCHLDMAPYASDLEEVLERAAHHGVSRVITVGIDAASSEKAIQLAEKYQGRPACKPGSLRAKRCW